ncbi:MAG: hypothetical protein SGBAC_012179 [Bacillariaceae sp.]
MDTEEEMDFFRISTNQPVNDPSESETQEECRATDEAFMLYTYAEKAALQIQQVFREKKQKRLEDGLKQHDTELGVYKEDDNDTEIIDEEKATDWTHRFAVVFIGFVAIMQFLRKFLTCFNDKTGSAEDEVRDIVVDESADAVGAMAVQAASSAGDGAAKGVAAVAMPVGGPVGGPFGGGGGGPEVVVAQVAVATGLAAAAAAAGTSIAASGAVIVPLNATVFSNQCGLPDPAVRQGQFSLTFKGFDQVFDARESLVVENLVMEAYNEITIGDRLEIDGVCADPIAREMQSLGLVQQVPHLFDENGVQFPSVEAIFNATLTCDRCSAYEPLFSLEQEDKVLTDEVVPEDKEDLGNLTVTNTSIAGLRHQRRLQDFGFGRVEFFQRLIQLVVFKMDELSKSGELVGGFVEISEAFVTPNSGEADEVLKMKVSYESKDGNGLFAFNYVDDETGEQQSSTVLVDPSDLNPLQTEEPSSAPSAAPSAQPSQETQAPIAAGIPTGIPSAVPSAVPSALSSGIPTEDTSEAPSISASVDPTINFSGQPTLLPTTAPSIGSSSSPTDAPSRSPSRSPSESPSVNPTPSPSESPSRVPSDLPSVRPSRSVVPSRTPSAMPSISMVPSVRPSKIPSAEPSMRPSGSQSPSKLPTTRPSISKIPTSGPSRTPSISPSAASESPSLYPSISNKPSSQPSAAPSDSLLPSVKPSLSMVPSSPPSLSQMPSPGPVHPVKGP